MYSQHSATTNTSCTVSGFGEYNGVVRRSLNRQRVGSCMWYSLKYVSITLRPVLIEVHYMPRTKTVCGRKRQMNQGMRLVLAEWLAYKCSSLTESEGEDVPIWRGMLKSSSSICRSSSFISRPGAPLQGEEDRWKGSEYSSVTHKHAHTHTHHHSEPQQ